MAEAIGYPASALVVVSPTMTSVLRLRLLNLAGAVAFVVYVFLISAFPIVATNAVIVGINLWFLWQAATRRDFFSLFEVPHTSPYLAAFLDFHRDQILSFMPGFGGPPAEGDTVLLVLRDLVPAGVFIGRPVGEGVMDVVLDDAIPQFRDLKVGSYLYERRRDPFTARGVRVLRSQPGSDRHRAYQAKVGFRPVGGGVLELPVGDRSETP